MLIDRNPFDGKQMPAGVTASFDQGSYQRIVAYQFLMSCLALEDRAAALQVGQEGILFRFLHYGAGFFGGKNLQVKGLIQENVAKGVELALRCLLAFTGGDRDRIAGILPRIKCLQLPYFREQNNAVVENTLALIRSDCSALGIETLSSGVSDRIDALSPISEARWSKFVLATTNCADPHAVFGNEVKYGSVDSMIAENLTEKGKAFSPFLNDLMQFTTLDLLPKIAHMAKPNLDHRVVPQVG